MKAYNYCICKWVNFLWKRQFERY